MDKSRMPEPQNGLITVAGNKKRINNGSRNLKTDQYFSRNLKMDKSRTPEPQNGLITVAGTTKRINHGSRKQKTN